MTASITTTDSWSTVAVELDEAGVADAGRLLDDDGCAELAAMFDDDERFRSTVDMARYRFGEGRYRYFGYPMPESVDRLRHECWPRLLPIARRWAERLGRPAPWPDDLDEWLARCHTAGQTRPTPLLLRYGPGDWNALHQDLYGELVFPLQIVIGLDRPGVDFTGGELVVVEQRARAQSRPTVMPLIRGHGVAFTTCDRPVRTARGWSAGRMRHGVSVVRCGVRRTLGLVFHDAS